MLSPRLLSLSAGVRLTLVLLVGLGLAVTGTYVGQGLLIARVLGDVLAGRDVSESVAAILGILVLQAFRVGLVIVREEQAMLAAAVIKERLRDRLYEQILVLGPGYTIRQRTGDLTSTFVDGVEALERYFALFLPQVFVSIIGAGFIVAYIWLLDPVVGTVVLLCAAVVPLAPALSNWLLRPSGNEWWEVYRRIYAENLDAVQGMSTLKAFDASERRGRELHEIAERFSRASIRLTLVSVAYSGIVGLGESAGTALAVGVGALRLADGALPAAALLTILLLARECFRPLHDLQVAFHQAYAATVTSGGILALLDARPDVPPIADGDRLAALPLRPAVRFDSVSFHYRDNGPDAVRSLSLEVGGGETVAIVGPSGAGKTTLVSLILRFFDPQAGRITIGGVDIREIAPERLRAGIAVVAQETYLFHGSVRDNLLLASPNATDSELAAALAAAEAAEFAARLPAGLDTIVGERGLKLSGGERQRIAIARALLKNAPLLILDEATSSIDSANEASIQRALERLAHGRTTIVIAHRLSTVRGADRIVVLEGGALVEQGRHASLLAQNGRYARLIAAQEGAA